MDMYIGYSELKTNKKQLEKLLDDLYYKYYKKDRLKHVTTGDDRLPEIKVTNDLVSFAIYFKNNYGREHLLRFDGKYNFLTEEILITSITPHEYFELNQEEHTAILNTLKALSEICSGYAFIEMSEVPKRLSNGKVEGYKVLLDEIYSKLSEEDKAETELLYKWIRNHQI